MRGKVTTTLLAAVALLLAAPGLAYGAPSETCIGAQEVIEHPAVTETVEHPAQTHDEYMYEQTTYTFRTRTPLYGSKEVKSITGWNFVDGGTTRVNSTTVAGHWVEASGTHQIPDVIINIVWGSDGVPEQYLGTGTVNLSSYGGPNRNVTYIAEKVTTDEGYTDWGPWSEPSTEPYTPDDLTDVATHTERTDWQTVQEVAPWVLVDTRTATDAEAWTETVTVTEAWTEVIEHEIVCTPETVTTPETDVPEPTPTLVVTETEPDVPTLAETGTPENTALLAGIATLLIGSGIVVFMLVRRK